jgi:hypothetical protein
VEGGNHTGHIDGVVAQPFVEACDQSELHSDRGGCSGRGDLAHKHRLQLVHLFVALCDLAECFSFLVVPAVGGLAPHRHAHLAHAVDQAPGPRRELGPEAVGSPPCYVLGKLVASLELGHDPQRG